MELDLKYHKAPKLISEEDTVILSQGSTAVQPTGGHMTTRGGGVIQTQQVQSEASIWDL